MDVKWDKEVDVVVVGYGLAGAVAATEAHDGGAKVVIMEKGRYPGGCSILSAGAVACADDIKAATDYLVQIQGGRVDTSLIHHFAQGMVDNEQYLGKLARVNNAKVEPWKKMKREAAHGAEDRDYAADPFGGSGLFPATYPFPGNEAFYFTGVAEIPGFKGFPWVQNPRREGVNLMKVAMDNVETRGIEVLLSTPGKRLVTDDKGAVAGIVGESAEKEIAIKAHRAVILACGGFEQNQWLQMQYLQGKPIYSMGPLTHTGDGIIMTQKVGAALWHMWHIHGSYGYKFPEFPIALRHTFGGSRNPKRIMPWIVVDNFGARYMNEYQPAPHDTGHRAMQLFDPDMPGYPRIPSYIIFDEVGRKRGPICRPLAVGQYIYEWSKDNMQEVAKGWIMREGSIRQLALKIRETDKNEGRMDPDILEATVSQWNENVRKRKDPLHRPGGTMMLIEIPPFHAVQVWPVITNTQGGPVHNAKQQVIDAFGQPIPHLYSAGELGSFFGHIYLEGGNLGECLISGRVAGQNAVTEPVA